MTRMKHHIEIKKHWAPPYDLEYDGKYVTLIGVNKRDVSPYGGMSGEPSVLVSVVVEQREADPLIEEVTERNIVISYNTEE